jgi:hypothetical protein
MEFIKRVLIKVLLKHYSKDQSKRGNRGEIPLMHIIVFFPGSAVILKVYEQGSNDGGVFLSFPSVYD